MPASARFLNPNPPVLFSPPAKHVASGSNNSFSSSSSSSSSRSANYFERLSRASAASAYLTDLTPPITPSNSNFEVESKDANFNRVLKESSDSTTKLYPLVRSTILLDEDAGYRSDTDVVGTISDARTAILISKRGGPSRRALKLMEDHTQYPENKVSGSEVVDVEVPLPAEEHVDDHVVAEVPVVEEEVEREYFDEENFSRDFDRAMDLIYQEVMNGTSVANYVASGPENQPTVSNITISPEADLLGDESDIETPAKPVIRAMEVDSDCSPLSLCDDPSFESISRSLVSPIQPNPLFMSPAIYNEPPVHGNSPLSSPYMAISTLMFGTRGERRSFPLVDLNGENLDIASLIRLEVVAGNNVAQPTIQQQVGFGFHMPPHSRLPASTFFFMPFPSSFSSYPSLQSLENATNHSPRRGPFPVTSPRYVQDPSPAQDLKQTSVESGDSARVRDVPLSPLPVDRDQALVGLGLGALTEGCLRSSDPISKLDSDYVEPGSIVASDANRCTANIPLNNQQCSPCVDAIEGSLKTGVEPSGVLSGSECLQSPPSLTSNVNQEVKVDLPSYQVDLGEYAGQVSIEGNIPRPVENILVEVIVESESEPNVLSDSMPRTNVFSDLVTSGRRCSTKSHEDLSSQHGDRGEDIQCTTPLIVQAPTFPGQDTSSCLSNTVPITPDSINVRSTSTLADNVYGAEPSIHKAHLATWTDDTPKQSIEHSSLLFQDSPLRRLTLALESDNFLARLGQSLASPLALSIASNGQKNRSSRLGPCSLTVSPKNDPRSPCSPSMEYFHPESYIRGCLGVLPSAQSSSGGGNTPPLSSSSRPDSAAFSSFSGLLRESKSFEGLGIGLPSDLVSGSLWCDSSILRANEVDRSDAMSTTEECQNIAQLADTISSPNDGTPSGTSPHVLFQVPTFVQRQLYVIPEQPTPLSTFSAARSRSPSPGSRPLKSSWSALSVLTRLRASSRSSWRSFSSKISSTSDEGAQIHDRRRSSSSSVHGHFCPLVEMAEGGPPPPSMKSNKFFQRFFQKIGSHRSELTSSSPPQPESATVRSPGVIEHPNVPWGFNILTRRSRRGRLEPITRKFQVLF